MNQHDWIGGTPSAPFRDIRNQRASKAARKAELCLELGRLCGRVPPPVLAGGVVLVRRWKAAQQAALSTAGSPRSSETELKLAIDSMASFWTTAEARNDAHR